MGWGERQDVWAHVAPLLDAASLFGLMGVSRLVRSEAAHELNRRNRARLCERHPEVGWLPASTPGLCHSRPPKDRYGARVFRFQLLHYSDDRPVEWWALLETIALWQIAWGGTSARMARLLDSLFGLGQGQVFVFRFMRYYDQWSPWASVGLVDAATGTAIAYGWPGTEFLRSGLHSKKARQATRWNSAERCSFQYMGCTFDHDLQRCDGCKQYLYCGTCAARFADEARCAGCGALSPCCDCKRCIR